MDHADYDSPVDSYLKLVPVVLYFWLQQFPLQEATIPENRIQEALKVVLGTKPLQTTFP